MTAETEFATETETPIAAEPAAEEDELVLGADTIVPEAPKVFGDDIPAPPAANPSRRRWMSAGSSSADEDVAPAAPAAEATPPPRVKLGGTLFERMSNVNRAASRDDEEPGDKDPLDIPRFLHRQNNQ